MAKRAKVQKTNAMRELDAAGIAYEVLEYNPEDAGNDYGLGVSRLLGEDPDTAFKTLVCTGASGPVVCCIPVSQELDLKKAAAAAGEKRLDMLHVKELEPLTGYVRGGCSPIGMKKRFPTIIDEAALLFDAVSVSGGRRGLSLRLDPQELIPFVEATVADVTKE